MAGVDNFGVQADVLRKHACSVDALADTLRTARTAGAQVRLGRGAYGKLPPGQLVAALIDPIQGYGLDALAAAADGLQSTADALRAASAGYLASDTFVQRTFDVGGLR